MGKTNKKYLLNILLIGGLTIFVLWLTLKDNYHEIVGLIHEIDMGWLIFILSWGIIYTMIIGWIITLLGKKYKKDYRFKDGIVNSFIGSFFSGITPSSTGGQFAQAYVFKKQGIKVSDGASILWADFIVYQTTMMVYVSILFLLRISHYLKMMNVLIFLIVVGYIINLCVIVFLWTMALFPNMYIKLSNWAVNLLSKLKFIKNKEKVLTEWNIQLTSFTKEIKRLQKDKKLIIQTVGINILRLTSNYSLPFIIARAMGIDLPWTMLLDVITLSSFVTMANAFIPIPGASGGTEFVFRTLFIPIVGGVTNASSIMILWRFSTYHFVMLLGGIIFLYQKYKQNRLKAESDAFE